MEHKRHQVKAAIRSLNTFKWGFGERWDWMGDWIVIVASKIVIIEINVIVKGSKGHQFEDL